MQNDNFKKVAGKEVGDFIPRTFDALYVIKSTGTFSPSVWSNKSPASSYICQDTIFTGFESTSRSLRMHEAVTREIPWRISLLQQDFFRTIWK